MDRLAPATEGLRLHYENHLGDTSPPGSLRREPGVLASLAAGPAEPSALGVSSSLSLLVDAAPANEEGRAPDARPQPVRPIDHSCANPQEKCAVFSPGSYGRYG